MPNGVNIMPVVTQALAESALRRLMSAMANGRWTADVPYDLWDNVVGVSTVLGYSKTEVAELTAWAQACGGWYIWDEQMRRAIFTPLEEWIPMWKRSTCRPARKEAPNIISVAKAAKDQAYSYRLSLLAILGILRLVDEPLVTRATEVLGSEVDAAQWFASPLLALGNQSPLDMLAADKVGLVSDVLHRIEHGFPV